MIDEVQQPRDFAPAKERLAEQDWADVAKSGLTSIAPADKGWVLGLVLMFSVFVGASTYAIVTMGKAWMESEATQNQALGQVLIKYAEIHEQQVRRLQEANKSLAEAIARNSERRYRAEAQTEIMSRKQ